MQKKKPLLHTPGEDVSKIFATDRTRKGDGSGIVVPGYTKTHRRWRHRFAAPKTMPQCNAYAEGWERIFGKKDLPCIGGQNVVDDK